MTVATFPVERQYRGLQTIDLWVELSHVDTDGTARTFKFSQRVLTYAAGSSTTPIIDARLGAVSRPTFALSDRRGQLRGVSVSLDLIDTDYLIRGWLENPFQDNLRAIDVAIFVIPEDQRRGGYTPIPFFRGRVMDPDYPADRMVRLTCEDPFTSAFGEAVAFYTVSKDEFPSAPQGSLGVTISPAYGDLTDGGAMVDPPAFTAETISGCDIGPFAVASRTGDVGYASIGGTVPTGLAVSEVGSAGHGTWDFPSIGRYVMVRFKPDGGAWGDPQELLPRDCPRLASIVDDSAVQADCDDMGSGTYEFYFGQVFNNLIEAGRRVTTTSPTATFYADGTGQDEVAEVLSQRASYTAWAVTPDGRSPLATPFTGRVWGFARPYRMVVTPVVGATSYGFARGPFRDGNILPSEWSRQWTVATTAVNGAGNLVFEDDLSDTTGEAISGLDVPQPKGIVPGVDVGTATDLNGIGWERFLFAHGPVKAFTGGYLNGAKIDDARYGTDILLPDMTGFDQMSATRVITIGGLDFMCGFLRGDALAAYQAADAPDFSANLYGVADGSDDLITDVLDQLVHVADNFSVARTPYASGSWNAPATFTDGTVIINTASVTAAKARLATLLSSTAGAWFYRDAVTAQQLHADLHLSAHVDGGWQPSGQYRVAVWDQTATPTRTLTETQDFAKGSFSLGKDDYSQLETVIAYAYRWDARTSAYEGQNRYMATSLAAKYGTKTLQDGPVSFRMRRTAEPCAEMVSLRAGRYGVPLRLSPGDVAGFHALDVLPGDCLAIDHTEGTGTGWTAHPVRVQEVSPDGDGHLVGLLVEDYRQATSLVGLEDIMAERSLGGSRENSCHTVGGIVRPYDWRSARVNGAIAPSSYIRTARVWVGTDGTATPKIYDDASNLITTGSAATATVASPAMQEIVLPYSAAVKNYEIRLTLAGGATDLGTVCWGRIDLEP